MRNYVKIQGWSNGPDGRVAPDMSRCVVEFFDDESHSEAKAALTAAKVLAGILKIELDHVCVYKRCDALPDIREIGETGGMLL